jgi:hypothetical protein
MFHLISVCANVVYGPRLAKVTFWPCKHQKDNICHLYFFKEEKNSQVCEILELYPRVYVGIYFTASSTGYQGLGVAQRLYLHEQKKNVYEITLDHPCCSFIFQKDSVISKL